MTGQMLRLLARLLGRRHTHLRVSSADLEALRRVPSYIRMSPAQQMLAEEDVAAFRERWDAVIQASRNQSAILSTTTSRLEPPT